MAFQQADGDRSVTEDNDNNHAHLFGLDRHEIAGRCGALLGYEQYYQHGPAVVYPAPIGGCQEGSQLDEAC